MTGMITAPGWTRSIGYAIVPGAVAGDVTVPGPINLDDNLLAVKHVSADLVTLADLTAEFTLEGANLINNDAGTSSAANFLLVVWAEGNV
ncbi:MAG: hypothetical protein V3S94_05255 [Gammaproteobacteria bacterium]